MFCAGRLDKDSEGLLILTNDGDLAHQLTHPAGRIVKRYRVLLHREFDKAYIPTLLNGIEYEGELLKAEKIVTARRWRRPPAPPGSPPPSWQKTRSPPPFRSETLLRQKTRSHTNRWHTPQRYA